MGKIKDEVGNKYGLLTVIKFHERDKRGQALWLCQCKCGNTSIVEGCRLRVGKTKSCGCMKGRKSFYKTLGDGEAALNKFITTTKQSAKRRGYSYSLTRGQVKKITQKNCAYCGSPPSNIIKSNSSAGDYVCNGLDRVDNTRGYELDNVVPCCTKCNLAKRVMSTEEFFDWIKKIHDHCRFFLGR